MKRRLWAAKVRFDGQGLERRGRIETGIETLFAAVLAFFSFIFFAQAYEEIPQLAATSWLPRSLSWVIAAAFGSAVIVRGYAARHSSLASLDFRVTKAAQDGPFLLLRLMVIITFVSLIDFISGKSIPLSAILNSLLGGFALVVPFYYATRFYSSAGFARVYLLQFLEEREQSDGWLVSAAKALDQTFNNRGLRLRPNEFRAGINLGLMRGSLDESKLRNLAHWIVNIGGNEGKDVIQITEEILRQVGPNAKILPIRPIRDRITADELIKIVGAIASIVAILAVLLRLIFGIQL
jgi:hypothetical protein